MAQEDLDIPDFLRMPQERRSAAWEGVTPPAPTAARNGNCSTTTARSVGVVCASYGYPLSERCLETIAALEAQAQRVALVKRDEGLKALAAHKAKEAQERDEIAEVRRACVRNRP